MDLIVVDFDEEDYFEIVRKVSLSMYKGSKLMMHNIIAYPKSRKALLKLVETGGYKYEELLEKNGLGIVKKER